jgi:hypothetical protein
MKAMTLKQYGEILQFIAKHHRFSRFNSSGEDTGIIGEAKTGLSIKYIINSFDTRTMEVWSVEFNNIRFATNFPYIPSEVPKDFEYENIYDLSMAYLRGEFVPTEEFYTKN